MKNKITTTEVVEVAISPLQSGIVDLLHETVHCKGIYVILTCVLCVTHASNG